MVSESTATRAALSTTTSEQGLRGLEGGWSLRGRAALVGLRGQGLGGGVRWTARVTCDGALTGRSTPGTSAEEMGDDDEGKDKGLEGGGVTARTPPRWARMTASRRAWPGWERGTTRADGSHDVTLCSIMRRLRVLDLSGLASSQRPELPSSHGLHHAWQVAPR